MLNANELTTGEKLLLQRRRKDLTAVQAAKRHKATLYRYLRWERDQEPGPRIAVGKLAFHEKAFLLRRRGGHSVAAFAKKLGVSAWWLSQMEDGEAPDMRLRDHWTSATRPRPSRARRAASPRAPARKRRRAS